MGGALLDRSHRKGSKGGAEGKYVPELPNVASLALDIDAAEARRLQVWGQRIIDDIRVWRHRQKRRNEGRQAVRS
jgi:hypothetical protein